MRIKNEPSAFSDIYVIGRTNWIVSLARNMAIDMGLNVARTGEEELLKEFCGLITDTLSECASQVYSCTYSGFSASGRVLSAWSKSGIIEDIRRGAEWSYVMG